jgi:hypothetical protein
VGCGVNKYPWTDKYNVHRVRFATGIDLTVSWQSFGWRIYFLDKVRDLKDGTDLPAAKKKALEFAELICKQLLQRVQEAQQEML